MAAKEAVKDKDKEKREVCMTDLPGVGDVTLQKLADAGFNDVLSIAVAAPAQLIDAAGLSEAAARKMITFARNELDMGFKTGNDVVKARENVDRISTGSKSFDELLGGGFETGAICECFGEFGSGKTQVGHILAVSCLKEHPDTVAFYIDTENTFRPERIKELCKGFGVDEEKILKNLRVAKAYNSDHQMFLVDKVAEIIDAEKLKVKLIVVDSLTAHFRAEFIGRGTLADRQQKLNRHMHALAKLADTRNLCVYVTNQVMADPSAFFGDPTRAIGGHIVAHASTFRLHLRKGKKGSRVAKLIDAPNLPDGECNFEVTSGGLKDVKPEK